MQENIWIHTSKYKQARLDYEWDKFQAVIATYMTLHSWWHYESFFWDITIVFLQLEASWTEWKDNE